ncbi:hypothetical protein BX659_1503 [Orenia metallireducens]|jgi:hypothetical protein|uniref:hypothetical protein n=1 Tax=Orenia metallireducens TaxID=1413210 RepID=UPI000D48A9D8|nr:hypothetical protein [Orenia metallireducens]PRX17502.1 hypothetical protein BX659_1503 [Orenia metallireducens]
MSRLEQIKNLIDHNQGEVLTIETIAEQLGLSIKEVIKFRIQLIQDNPLQSQQ